jgi:hypothetical protein
MYVCVNIQKHIDSEAKTDALFQQEMLSVLRQTSPIKTH